MKLSAKPEGFTLTELLIVLLIIGILVAIAIPNYMAFVIILGTPYLIPHGIHTEF